MLSAPAPLRAARVAAAALRAPIAFVATPDRGALRVDDACGLDAAAARALAEAVGLPALAADARAAGVPAVRRVADAEPLAVAGACALLAVAVAVGDAVACACVLDRRPRAWTPDEEALLGDLAAAAATRGALEHQVAARRAEREASALTHALSDGIARARDVHSALLLTLGHVCQLAGWDHGEGWLPDEEGTRLVRSPASFTLRDDLGAFEAASGAATFARGEGLPGTVWETGEVTWVRDLSRHVGYRRGEAAAAAGFGAAVAIPVLARRTVAAVLVFHARTIDPDDERVARSVADAAAQLGPVLRRKAAEDALRRSEATLAGILHVAADAIVSIDRQQRIRLFNTGAERVFGYAASEVLGQPLELLLPEAARANHRAHVQGFMRSEVSARWMNERATITGRRRGGETFPAEATISRFGATDDCVCTVVLRDVTERQRVERALTEARHELHSILESVAEGIVGVDADGHVTFVNPAALRMLGYAAEEMIGREVHALVHHTRADGAPYPVAECPTHLAIASGRARSADRDVFWRRDGQPLPVEYTSTPLRDGPTVRGAVVTFRDVTERRAAEEALRALALRDELTGLHNRRGFMALAEQQLALSRRMGEACLLLFIDLDDFKAVNDTLGHAVGDEALAEVADVLRDTFRQSDVLARLGGDEFVALAIHSRDETAASIRARLERRVAAANAHAGRRFRLALSIGAASVAPDDPRPLEALMAEADAALYEQKRLRRAARGGAAAR